jgi:hypothetical protein
MGARHLERCRVAWHAEDGVWIEPQPGGHRADSTAVA